jgi:hypothetical protein
VDLERKHCPQCEMPVLDSDRLCPFCGKRQPEFVISPARWAARVGSILLLLVIGLPAGLAGLCGLFLIQSSSGPGLAMVAVGAGVLALTIWAVVASWRK